MSAIPNKYTDLMCDEIKSIALEKEKTTVRHKMRTQVLPELQHGYRVYCRKSRANKSWYYTMKYGIFGFHYH